MKPENIEKLRSGIKEAIAQGQSLEEAKKILKEGGCTEQEIHEILAGLEEQKTSRLSPKKLLVIGIVMIIIGLVLAIILL
jgi:hypothetical protein